MTKASAATIRNRVIESRHGIEVLADKWRIMILHILEPGPQRTGDLQRAMEEVSPKVLTQTLRGMERDGLIERRVYPVAPPRVEYELTEMGRSVHKPLHELCRWAKTHAKERDAARRRFDEAAKKKPR